jgi:hypothetical protein
MAWLRDSTYSDLRRISRTSNLEHSDESVTVPTTIPLYLSAMNVRPVGTLDCCGQCGLYHYTIIARIASSMALAYLRLMYVESPN